MNELISISKKNFTILLIIIIRHFNKNSKVISMEKIRINETYFKINEFDFNDIKYFVMNFPNDILKIYNEKNLYYKMYKHYLIYDEYKQEDIISYIKNKKYITNKKFDNLPEFNNYLLRYRES